jgi:hypothetical protein
MKTIQKNTLHLKKMLEVTQRKAEEDGRTHKKERIKKKMEREKRLMGSKKKKKKGSERTEHSWKRLIVTKPMQSACVVG